MPTNGLQGMYTEIYKSSDDDIYSPPWTAVCLG